MQVRSGLRFRLAGFTLVELLVVIGVIAVLISILLPSLRRARESAARVACMSSMRQLTVGWIMYTDVHKGQMPSAETSLSNYPHSWVDFGPTEQAIRDGVLFPFVGTIQIFRCRLYDNDYQRSYSINDYMNGQYMSAPSRRWGVPATRLGQVRRASEVFVFIEEWDRRGHNLGSFVVQKPQRVWVDFPAIWHGSGVNLSFADGHVEYWKWMDSRTTTVVRQYIAGTVNHHHPDPTNQDLVRLQGVAGPYGGMP